MADMLIYIGSTIIFLWGIGHLVASKPVISGFSSEPLDNRRVITMEWIAEGLALCFIGVVAALSGGGAVLWACVGMLVALAVLSAFTGARTSVIPMKLCPVVKLIVAALFTLGNVL
jgi:hypothetical protein